MNQSRGEPAIDQDRGIASGATPCIHTLAPRTLCGDLMALAVPGARFITTDYRIIRLFIYDSCTRRQFYRSVTMAGGIGWARQTDRRLAGRFIPMGNYSPGEIQ